jgi:GIY-YIG catalytic domain
MTIYTIYLATNVVNGKQYVGFDSAWPRRQGDHLTKAFNENIQNKGYFHKAIKKYGKSKFDWVALYQSRDRDHTLNEMEQYFITEYRTYSGFEDCNGYNLTLGGDGVLGRLTTIENRGKPTKRSRAIITPQGIYESVTQASVATGVKREAIYKKLKSQYIHDWCYVDSPKLLKDKSMRTTSRARAIYTPVGTFASVDIAIKLTKLSESLIRFRLKSAHQLDWYYADDPKVATDHIVKGSRAIITPLGRFASVAIASKKTGLHKSTILSRLTRSTFPDWYYTDHK